MNFGEALEALRAGAIVARRDWPTGVVLMLVPGSTITVDADRPLGKAAPALVGHAVRYKTHIDMVSGDLVYPWLPFVDDMLADDWLVVVQ